MSQPHFASALVVAVDAAAVVAVADDVVVVTQWPLISDKPVSRNSTDSPHYNKE